ncbi:hypothetical protein PPERSA_07276 [Pseudocohnilembus persalinus]|uniref:Uncharacterized protein n=1 Tax=Pseudocohnilembus persalinus TaxID=266149 RepID=A0A0V0QCY3_PSEPJ|nr:hypothetical protein PPERSA_07276 [Pseudocohnilembus persalinus]|eukprot:KRX00079.1 hypothetical protein PPERSA_07276 [Pseudocohnilembus persalinus]
MDQLNQQLIAEKLKELSQSENIQNSTGQKVEPIKQLIKAIDQSQLKPEEKQQLNKLLIKQLIEFGAEIERKAILTAKLTDEQKSEISDYEKEYAFNQQKKQQLQQLCQVISQNIKHIEKQKDIFKQQEEVKRSETKKKYQESIEDIKDKLDNQEKESQELKLKTEELKIKLEEEKKAFQESQDLFGQETKKKVEDMMSKLNEMKVQSEKMMEIRTKIGEKTNEERTLKLQIVLFQKKFEEHSQKIEQTREFLEKFEIDLLKIKFQQKKATDEYEEYQLHEKIGDVQSLKINNLNQKLTEEIDQLKTQQGQLRNEILQIQEKIKKL